MNKSDWTTKMNEKLKGRTIREVRIMTEEEMNELGWYSKSVVLVLDDGNLLFFSQDDEGNDAGSGYLTYEDLPVLPTFR